MGVTIFSSEILYHLYDKYMKYLAELREERKRLLGNSVVVPCVLKIDQNSIFKKTNPIIIGVKVIQGRLKIGTPIVVLVKSHSIGLLGNY